MRRDLTVEEFGEGFNQPWLATMAVFRKNGSVLLSPIWFLWEDSAFNVGLVRGDWKERYVRANPRVGLCIAEEASYPGRVCEAWGDGVLQDDPGGVQMQRIAAKYLGERNGKQWVEQLEPHGFEWVLLTLRPSKLRLLDHRDELELLEAKPQYIDEGPRSPVK